MESRESTRVIPAVNNNYMRVIRIPKIQLDWQKLGRKPTGRITISPGAIFAPSVFFFAKAETASRAIDDAVSKPSPSYRKS